MSLSRRHVLAATTAVGVAGGLGVGTAAWRWWERPPGEGLQSLADDEYAFVQALAEAWMPAGGTPELSGADAALGNFIDGLISAMHRISSAGHSSFGFGSWCIAPAIFSDNRTVWPASLSRCAGGAIRA